MTDRELMQMARDTLVHLWDGCPADEDLILELNDRLAQPEPEPVAYSDIISDGGLDPRNKFDTAPPQRNWQGLTDEEMFDCLAQTDGEAKRLPLGFKWFAEAIEAKLKEKNT
jgi:hypothetical protein